MTRTSKPRSAASKTATRPAAATRKTTSRAPKASPAPVQASTPPSGAGVKKTGQTGGPAAKHKTAPPPEAPRKVTRSKKATPSKLLKLQLIQLPPRDGNPAPTPQPPIAAVAGETLGALMGDPALMRRIAQGPQSQAAIYWGVVEADFTARTGLTGQAVQPAIEAAPDHDVYYTNPSPHNEALFINAWHQGYTTHPRFAEAAALVLQAADIPVAELDRLEPADRFVSGHCIFGNHKFWSAYLDFLDATLKAARGRLTSEQLQWLDSPAADPRKLHHGATYWHFIVERLLPIFLRGRGEGLRACRFDVPERDAKLNGHQRRLREMKDVAHRTKSSWMYSCWLHYRNLYLLQVAGKKWCEANLPAISKSEVMFK